MKYFKDAAETVYAFEADGSQDGFIPADLVAISKAEADALRGVFSVLDEKRAVQLAAIRSDYEAACLAPVFAASAVWSGGFDSAIKLDAAMRLAQSAGLSSVTFYDVENAAHVLAFPAALAVVIVVAADFQAKLARKQQLMLAIAQASSVEDVQALTWSAGV